MIYDVLHRKRFNDLVEKLRREGNMDEHKLAYILKYRKKIELTNRVFFVCVVIPSFIYGGYLISQFIYGFENLSKNDVGKAILELISLAFFIYIFALLFKANIDREWKYTFLMTEGKRSKGKIIIFTKDYLSLRRYCEYYFYDETGHKNIAKMQVALQFDPKFEFEPETTVNVAYDEYNPRMNIIVSPKMQMFNLRKE